MNDWLFQPWYQRCSECSQYWWDDRVAILVGNKSYLPAPQITSRGQLPTPCKRWVKSKGCAAKTLSRISSHLCRFFKVPTFLLQQ